MTELQELIEAYELLDELYSQRADEHDCRQFADMAEAYRSVAADLRDAVKAMGEVVVTRNADMEIVMVSRQDEDGKILKVIASTTHAGAE